MAREADGRRAREPRVARLRKVSRMPPTPKWIISKMVRSRQRKDTTYIASRKMVFSVGRDTKQSTVCGHGERVHTYEGITSKP